MSKNRQRMQQIQPDNHLRRRRPTAGVTPAMSAAVVSLIQRVLPCDLPLLKAEKEGLNLIPMPLFSLGWRSACPDATEEGRWSYQKPSGSNLSGKCCFIVLKQCCAELCSASSLMCDIILPSSFSCRLLKAAAANVAAAATGAAATAVELP